MAITVQNVRDRFPEFEDDTAFTDGRIQTWITKGEAELSEGEWGGMYNEAMLVYVAHYLSWSTMIANSGGSVGSVGPIASKSVGDVSISFASVSSANASAGESFWLSTPYGQEYWRLVMLCGATMVTV